MKLVIPEKSTLGLKIATALGIIRQEGERYYCENDFVVAGLEGHVMHLPKPHEYDIKYKDQRCLPILIDVTQFRIASENYRSRKYYAIEELLPLCTEIYHCGDPDREGQLIVDNVLISLGNTKPVKRPWLTNLSEINLAFDTAKSNDNYLNWYYSALARTAADYLIGMNYSTVMSIIFRMNGYSDKISIGRIQTPVLKLIYDRVKAVKSFKKKYHFGLSAIFSDGEATFKANLVFDDVIKPFLDEDGQLLDKAIIDDIKSEINNQPAIISNFSVKPKSTKAPLPYTLPDIQIAAMKKYKRKKYSPADILNYCQTLYDNLALDYPRTEKEYLPEKNFEFAPAIIAKLQERDEFKNLTPDLTIKSRAWDDSQLGAHYGLTPLIELDYLNQASEDELNIFNMISLRFFMQFYPDYETENTAVTVKIGKYTFKATSSKVINQGWKQLTDTAESESDDAEDDTKVTIPKLKVNQSISLTSCETLNKETAAPKLFDQASLLQAMSSIANYVDDIVAEYESITGKPYCDNVDEYKKILRAKPEDGGQLGTGATQAGIIETVKERFVDINDKGQLTPNNIGTRICEFFTNKEVIETYSFLTNPITSASYEKQLKEIVDGTLSFDEFMDHFIKTTLSHVPDLIKFAHLMPKNLNGLVCPTCNEGFLFLKKYTDKETGEIKDFFACSRHPECNGSFKNDNGKPLLTKVDVTEHKCTKCETGYLIRKTSTNKKTNKDFDWYYCNNYNKEPKCEAKFFDDKGKPQFEEKPVIVTEHKCTKCETGYLIRKTSTNKATKKDFDWYYCNNYNKEPKCEAKFFDDKGKPQFEVKPKVEAKLTGEKCPKCKKGELVIRAGEHGNWKSCNMYPKCKYSDTKSKPKSVSNASSTINKPWLKAATE